MSLPDTVGGVGNPPLIYFTGIPYAYPLVSRGMAGEINHSAESSYKEEVFINNSNFQF